MVKVFFCITRKPGMSPEEFRRYWKDVHGPIAARIPELRRYVQHHTVHPNPLGGAVPSYDGVAELWFDDYEAARRALQGKETAAAVGDHEHFMADHARCAMFLTEEHVIVGDRR